MAAATSKLDSLSREDLIRFAKKQLVNNKDAREELARLKKELQSVEERESKNAERLKDVEAENGRYARRVEELETKQSFLIEASTEETNEATTTELVLKARVADLEEEAKEMGPLKDENKQLSVKIEDLTAQIDCLTKELESSRAEFAALREQQSTADVFSLEVEDYARKVRTLEKDLASAKLTTGVHEAEIATLKTQLDEARASYSSIEEEKNKFQQDAQETRQGLYESQLVISQLKSEVSSLNEQLNGLLENQGSERLGLGREITASQQRITALEEVSEALKEENDRLKTETAAAESRARDIETEFESFKSRARFVLQQKATTAGEDEAAKNKSEELEATVASLRDTVEQLKKDVAAKHDECEKQKEKAAEAAAELERKRREVEELQTSLSSTMDELRSYRNRFETVVSQLTETRQRLETADSQKSDCRQETLKAEAVLSFERNRFEEALETVRKQLNEERKRREELSSQLDESRREQKTIRVPPVAAVQPHICEFDFASDQRKSSPEHTFQPTQEDRSLEDVLFGEENLGDLMKVPTVESIPELMEEVARLRKQAEHTTSLLNESEAANGRLTEQSRCLKEEIRRLERNEERKSHLENIEYLKNVIVKFLTPEKVAAEKAQLIPILNTMLRLSEDELQILQRAAETHPGMSDPSNASWGSYFKWGGMA